MYNSAYCFAIFSMSKQFTAFFLAFKHSSLCRLSSVNTQSIPAARSEVSQGNSAIILSENNLFPSGNRHCRLQTIFPVSEIIILPQNTRFLTRTELRFHIQIPKSNNRLSSTQNYVLRSQNMNSYSLAYCFSDFAIKSNIEVIYFFNLFNCRLRSIIKIWSIFCYVNFFVLIFISQLRLATKRFYKRYKRI